MDLQLQNLQMLQNIPAILGSSPGLVILAIFFLVTGIFTIYSLLLLYHWVRYGSLYPMVWVMMVAYFGIAFVLIGTMLGSAILLT